MFFSTFFLLKYNAIISNPELLSRIRNYNLEKSNISSTLKTQASYLFLHRFFIFTPQRWIISITWELRTYSKKAIFLCTISVGMNCRDGFNTLLFTEQQEHELLRFVLMIRSHDISKIIGIITHDSFFTDYSFFSLIIVFYRL